MLFANVLDRPQLWDIVLKLIIHPVGLFYFPKKQIMYFCSCKGFLDPCAFCISQEGTWYWNYFSFTWNYTWPIEILLISKSWYANRPGGLGIEGVIFMKIALKSNSLIITQCFQERAPHVCHPIGTPGPENGGIFWRMHHVPQEVYKKQFHSQCLWKILGQMGLFTVWAKALLIKAFNSQTISSVFKFLEFPYY